MAHGLKNQKGFLRNHQLKREYPYHNTHNSANKLDTHIKLRFGNVHKKSGASRGLNAKQFDVSRRDYCKHFNSHKSIADLICLPHTCWGFGHHLTLGGNQKFKFN